MGAKQELDALLADPECHAILINALSEYSSLLSGNVDDFANEFELAHIERSLIKVARLQDLLQRWR